MKNRGKFTNLIISQLVSALEYQTCGSGLRLYESDNDGSDVNLLSVG